MSEPRRKRARIGGGPIEKYNGAVQQAIVSFGPERLVEEATAFAIGNGIVMFEQDNQAIHCPFGLVPFPVPASAFGEMEKYGPLFGRLVDRISRSPDFINDTLKGAAETDPFTAQLLKILNTVEKEGNTQPLRLGLFRSDYMIHTTNDEGKTQHRPLQVENNTIAASFAGLSTAISSMHDFLFSRHLPSIKPTLPENKAIQNLAKGIAIAHKRIVTDDGNWVAIMVIQPGEKNAVDQRSLEYALWEGYRVPVVRASLADIESAGSLAVNGNLQYGNNNVSVVYFRAGYTPNDYKSQTEWDAVLKIERSSAIKCPSVAYHLAGTKKIQQQIALPGVLERFCDEKDASVLRECFAGLWGLEKDDEATKAIIKQAIENNDDYVLKPQREGGGNNFYHEEMANKLKEMSVSERSAYILMQKIKPTPVTAHLVMKGELKTGLCLSEFGLFATYLGDGKNELHNEMCGHLVRTKSVGVDEGGVASGFSCLSSAVLIDC